MNKHYVKSVLVHVMVPLQTGPTDDEVATLSNIIVDDPFFREKNAALLSASVSTEGITPDIAPCTMVLTLLLALPNLPGKAPPTLLQPRQNQLVSQILLNRIMLHQTVQNKLLAIGLQLGTMDAVDVAEARTTANLEALDKAAKDQKANKNDGPPPADEDKTPQNPSSSKAGGPFHKRTTKPKGIA